MRHFLLWTVSVGAIFSFTGCSSGSGDECSVDSECQAPKVCINSECVWWDGQPRIAENVRYLEQEEGFYSVVVDFDRLDFEFEKPAFSYKVRVGDIIVGKTVGMACAENIREGYIEGYPCEGYLRNVESVEEDGNRLALMTTDASIWDAVRGKWSVSIDLTSGDVSYSGTYGSLFQALEEYPGRVDLGGITVVDNESLSLELVDGSYLELKPSFEMSADSSSFGRGKELRIVAVGEFNMDLMAEATMKAELITEGDTELFKFSKSIWFAIGWFPVNLTVTFRFIAGYEANASVVGSITTGILLNSRLEMGALYSWEDGWQTIWNPSWDPAMHEPVSDMNGSISVMVFIRPDIEAKFYGQVGPGFYLQPYLKGIFRFLPEWCRELYAGLSAVLELRLGIFKKLGLENQSWDLWSKEWELDNTCECSPHQTKVCKENTEQVWWKDSCEVLEELFEDCALTGQTCVDGACGVCEPDCDGKECGPDGCGDTCTSGCGAGESCDESTGRCDGHVGTCHAEYNQPAQSCNTSLDCCPADLPDGVICNQDYPYIYSCDTGACNFLGCSSDAECTKYFESIDGVDPDYWQDKRCQ